LVVNPSHRCHGIGAALMRHALQAATQRGHSSVLLVGDAAYYGRFGFSAERARGIWLPGLADNSRLLGLELGAGALEGARGTIQVPRRRATPLTAAAAALARPPKAA
jgi:predicted N-acetyltransferase YhbS